MKPAAACALIVGLAGLVACGGKVVLETSAGGGAPTGSGTGATGATSTGSGPGGCTSHADCPGGLCLFASGTCAAPCTDFCDTCGPGSVCDACAASSCPGCDDCLAACVPAPAGSCDDDDPCPAGRVCMHEDRQCVEACTVDGDCATSSLLCAGCVTGSCCGCKDCVSACLPGE